MDRRKFLRLSGSLAIGGAILSVAGAGIWKLFTKPGDLFYGTQRTKGFSLTDGADDEPLVSPYRRTFGFELPDVTHALDIEGGSIFIATPNQVYIYGLSGELQYNFSIPTGLRDLAVFEGKVYALFPTAIEVYSRQGDLIQRWDACSDEADYCSLAVCKEGVFVTDASNKHICKYHPDGTFARFIESPQGFVVPSYCFGITAIDGRIFCSNPGRHRVEQYTTDGTFVASFGRSGIDKGAFSGCCNPAIITPAQGGDLLTSEKGIPRISCYSQDGSFRSVLLDAKALGGGHEAYRIRVMKDKLIVVGGKKVSVFQYNRQQSQLTDCGQCDRDCPLKV
jgi:hypothetical protein